MSDALVAITATEARSEGERLQGQGLGIRDVALGVMRKARAGFMAPDDNTAFLASVSAIIQLYPERKETLMDEARAIGDRTKMLNALMQGVPVDFDRFDPAPVPDDAIGLIALWREASNQDREREVVDPASSPPADPEFVCSCGGVAAGRLHFDRSLCACGAMHHYCDDCGCQAEPCDPDPASRHSVPPTTTEEE